MITGLIGNTPPTVWRLQTLAKFGVFNVDPICNTSDDDADYPAFLEKLPLLSIKMSDLKQNQAAFWMAPKALTATELTKLCPPGTNAEILERAFAKQCKLNDK